jgi:hypothetical protein
MTPRTITPPSSNLVVRDANQVDVRLPKPAIRRVLALDRALLRSVEGRRFPGHDRLMSTRLGPRLARLGAALGVVCLLWACNAPFIPVPPPGETSFSSQVVSDGAGGQKTVWITRGGVNGNAALARFFVYDTNRGTGVIATAMQDGSYEAPAMDGTENDRVEVSYETPAGDFSAAICVLLADGPKALRCP